MTGPTFFIAGAQKAGTTSLYAMLREHPDVFMCTPKEPGYFIRGFGDPESWQSVKRPFGGNPSTWRPEFRQGVFEAEEYAALFASEAAQRARHRGEASTPYLPSRYAARRIAETCPGARIILMLRDPVERAYSAWGYNSVRGNENTTTFEAAMEQELSGDRDDWDLSWRYLYAGLYGQHVSRFFEHFDRSDILILRSDALRHDADRTIERVCNFLEIPVIAPTGHRDENVTVRHDNPLLARARAAFTTPGGLKSAVKRVVPGPIRAKIKRGTIKALDQFGRRPPDLDPRTVERLAEYYADDTRHLQQIAGIDISDWTPLKTGGRTAAGE